MASEPATAFKFDIGLKHIKCATQEDPCNCVLAQALMDRPGGKLLEVRVLKTRTTLVYSGGKTAVYQTPLFLREIILHYDKTGKWNLKPGTYALDPIPRSQRKKAVRERARKRRVSGDIHMNTKYLASGRYRVRQMDPRKMNLSILRKTCR